MRDRETKIEIDGIRKRERERERQTERTRMKPAIIQAKTLIKSLDLYTC